MPPKPEKREVVFAFIRENLLKGVCPSLTEIQKHFRLKSPSTVAKHIAALVREGKLERLPGRRSLRLPGEIQFAVPLPVLGAISAGVPELRDSDEDAANTSDVRSFGVPIRRGTFRLKVEGDSMIGAGINPGDQVILEPGEAKHGDIVAAYIDGKNTLKRYLVRNGKHLLHSENPKYPDFTPSEELVIQGIVVGLVRAYKKRLK
jgi:repressor LexA